MSSRVRVLAKSVTKHPKYMSVDSVRAREVAVLLSEVELTIPTWDFEPCHLQSNDFEEMCLFYLIFNAINYCYFDQDGEKFSAGEHSGSTLAGKCLVRGWGDISDPFFLSKVDENYLLCELFDAEVPISLVKERTLALREVGEFLNKESDFTFEKLFARSCGDAYSVSQFLPTLLPSWRDPFAKRSQLFVGMVQGRFQYLETPPFTRSRLSELTVFADYQVPRTLMAMGILVPTASLLSELYCKQFIRSGSRKELEIRASTIIGADLLTEELNRIKGTEDINALHTDYLLWGASRRSDIPEGVFSRSSPNHHYTMTTDY